MRTISVTLPDSLLRRIESEARRRRMTKSALVRESLEMSLRKWPGKGASCYDLARDLAGSVRGLSQDIASNPKYMEDFGK